MNTQLMKKFLPLAVSVALYAGTVMAEEKANAAAPAAVPEQAMQPGMWPGGMGGPGPWGGQGMRGGPWGGHQRGGPGWGGGGPGMNMNGPWGEPVESLTARLASLKQQLAITAGQDGAWNGYTKALTEQNEARSSMRQQMATNPPRDPMEMETRRIAAMEHMLGHKKAVLQGYKDLLAKLDDRQKALLGPAQVPPCVQ
ncbi:MAG: Spy/CpxP family protein refolding chaperone [Magnetococcales bacterium]|nr:Spy/CpxP family protein refolding chaperone [Magnetococcales bacterium]